MNFMYDIPQECGTRTATSFVSARGKNSGFSVVGTEPFAFSYHNFSLDNLIKARHRNELKKSNENYLYIDYAMRGLGSHSCGPNPEECYELHAHEFRFVFVISANTDAAAIVRLYKGIGYDGIVITDHFFSLFYEWFGNEIDENNHKSVIDRYLKGYYNARNEGEKCGFKVFCGAEVRFDNTINDYLIYGLEESDFYALPLLNRLGGIEELPSILPDYALIVQVHPFRDNMTVQSPEKLHGVEIYNGCTEKIRNDIAKIYATHYNKTATSGSDFHGPDQLAKGGIVTSAAIKTSKELADILKNRNFEIIENY